MALWWTPFGLFLSICGTVSIQVLFGSVATRGMHTRAKEVSANVLCLTSLIYKGQSVNPCRFSISPPYYVPSHPGRLTLFAYLSELTAARMDEND